MMLRPVRETGSLCRSLAHNFMPGLLATVKPNNISTA